VFGVRGGKADGADVHVPYELWEFILGGRGRIARTSVFSVTETPPFVCIICVGEGRGGAGSVCKCIGAGRGSALTRRGEKDVDVLAILVGVEQ